MDYCITLAIPPEVQCLRLPLAQRDRVKLAANPITVFGKPRSCLRQTLGKVEGIPMGSAIGGCRRAFTSDLVVGRG